MALKRYELFIFFHSNVDNLGSQMSRNGIGSPLGIKSKHFDTTRLLFCFRKLSPALVLFLLSDLSELQISSL